MTGRAPRGKPRASKRGAPPAETAKRLEISPEHLESLHDDDAERPTTPRLPTQSSFFPPEDPKAPNKAPDDATVRKRVLVGPDGVPRMLDAHDLDEPTHPYVPSKMFMVAEMLVAIVGMFDEIGDSSRTRELRTTARRYERIVKGWNAASPSDAQCDATFDLVTELHGKVIEARRLHRLSL